jgi:uncharacterized protein (DUF1778 family)
MGNKPRAEAPARPIYVRVSPAELARLKRAAQTNHQNLSQFVRDAVDSAAGDLLEDDDERDR